MPDFRSPEFIAKATRYITLLTAVAGLVTAVFKPQNHDVTKASYQELSLSIEKLNAGLAQEHDSVERLRGYLAAKEGEALLAPPPMPSLTPMPSSLPPVSPHVTGRMQKPAVMPAPSAAMSPPLAMTATATPQDVPPPAPAPAMVHPVAFDSVLKSLK